MIQELIVPVPPGTIEKKCLVCNWVQWVGKDDPKASDSSFVCQECQENPMVGFKCTACNRHSQKPHREMVLETKEHAHHCADCKDVPYRTFAKVVYCWCCADNATSPEQTCGEVATQTKNWPKDCECPACWQTFYHVCDHHAADWVHDLPEHEYKERMRSKGAVIVDNPDGGWSWHWPESVPN